MPNVPYCLAVFSFRDASDSVSFFTGYLGTTDVNAARVAAGALGAALGGASKCTLVSYSLTWSTRVNYARGPGPQLGATTGVFVWQTAAVGEYAVTYLPAIKQILIDETSSTGIAINLARPEIISLIAELQNGAWCSPFGNDLTAVDSAFVQFAP